jgi:predicted nucleotidyltransferase
MKGYKFFKKIDEICEQIRNEALIEVHKISRILSHEYGVKKVVLFGSLTTPHRFSFHSDIDLAVEGLKEENFLEAYGEVLINSKFKVDLVMIEQAGEKFKQRLEKEGKVIYERC